jgi:hypothetical protein
LRPLLIRSFVQFGSLGVGDQLKPTGGFESPGLIVCLAPGGVIFIDVFVQQSLEISRDTIAT